MNFILCASILTKSNNAFIKWFPRLNAMNVNELIENVILPVARGNALNSDYRVKCGAFSWSKYFISFYCTCVCTFDLPIYHRLEIDHFDWLDNTTAPIGWLSRKTNESQLTESSKNELLLLKKSSFNRPDVCSLGISVPFIGRRVALLGCVAAFHMVFESRLNKITTIEASDVVAHCFEVC